MSIKFVNGNILTFPERDEDTIVCHQVNCKGVMGAGLAKQIRDKWPDVYDRYRLMVETCGEFMLGSFHEVKVGPHLYVANLYGQEGYGRDKRYTNFAKQQYCQTMLIHWTNSHCQPSLNSNFMWKHMKLGKMDIYILHGGRHASTRLVAMLQPINCLRSTNL